MAYDKIITVRSRLDHCVDYVLNHEKTDMAAVLDYIGRADKNTLPDGRSVLETAINCNLDSAYWDMQETKRRWGKPGGVLGYHLIHAFAPGEVTPEQAHEIGVEFAARLLGDRYEAVISTHLDRDHLHCHILFNSVSFVDGAKYKNTFKDYFGDIRGISNEVSRAHGLSVIEPGEGGRHYAEWDAEVQGRPTLRALVRQDIDAAIASAYTMKTFWRQLEELGYTVKRGGQCQAYRGQAPRRQTVFPAGRPGQRLHRSGYSGTAVGCPLRRGPACSHRPILPSHHPAADTGAAIPAKGRHPRQAPQTERLSRPLLQIPVSAGSCPEAPSEKTGGVRLAGGDYQV